MRIIKEALPQALANGILRVFEEAQYTHITQSEDTKYHPEEKYSCSYHKSRGVEQHPRFMEASKKLVEYVSDLGNKADMRAYKMIQGDHFRVHDDDTNGVGFVYYLCDWKWDWGGILHVEKDGKMFPILHKFNQLVVIDRGRPHFVSVVAPYAKPRYAIIGFIQ
jgi:Rps23 Pro-64 3,4-dihydroxylase Tpa1-like proline 4-hydroxylase